MFNAKGTEASEKSGDVSGVRDSEGVVEAVVLEGEAKKFGGEGVGFYIVQGGKARNEKGEVRGVVILDAEVVNH